MAVKFLMADRKPRCGDNGYRRHDGEPCRQFPMAGQLACPTHVGKSRQVAKAEGQVRVELANWGTDDSYVDPGEQFLRLIAQSARRCELYSDALQQDYEDRKLAALVGTAWSEGGPSGEYIRGLADLEARERAFCAKLCAQAITAGIEARRVQLAAQQVDQLDTVLRGVLAALGHNPDDPKVRQLVVRQIAQPALT